MSPARLRAAVGGAGKLPEPIPPKDPDDVFRPPSSPTLPAIPPQDKDDVFRPA